MTTLDKVNGAASKCGDIAEELLAKAIDMFKDLVDSDQRQQTKSSRPRILPKETDDSHESANSKSVQVNWQKSGEVIELTWHDVDGGVLNVSMKDTGEGFHLRFLRHLVYHANCLMENAYLLFMKLNVALNLTIPIEKLMKCSDLNLNTLTHHERFCLVKAKRELDSSLEKISSTIASYRFQLFHLLKYAPKFKKMRGLYFKQQKKQTFGLIKMNLEDSLLMR